MHDRHELPVQSVVVLLQPEANSADLTGVIRYYPPHGGSLEFHFEVVRLWLCPVDTILRGGLGTLPLAPLSDVPPAALPGVIRRLGERLSDEAEPAEAATLWTSTYILMGLRYPPELVTELFRGVNTMKESATYQAILNEGRSEGRSEGRTEEARRLLLMMGSKRFGIPGARILTTLDDITSVEKLEQLTERLLDVSGWDELLASS